MQGSLTHAFVNTLRGPSSSTRLTKNVLKPFQEVVTVSQPTLLGHP